MSSTLDRIKTALADRKVAVKVLRPELVVAIGADRFLNEIKVTANLQHPNILVVGGDAERRVGTAHQRPIQTLARLYSAVYTEQYIHSRQTVKPQWFQILLALADRDLHGADIMKEVLDRTAGQMHLWPGQLYGSLKELSNEGFVVEVNPPSDARSGGGRPRFYRITSPGKRALVNEVKRLAGFLEAARSKNLIGRLETG